jgi:hypothetical protein
MNPWAHPIHADFNGMFVAAENISFKSMTYLKERGKKFIRFDHFLQTTRVGCGQASTASSETALNGCTRVVCRYETAGNVVGQSFSDVSV